MMDILRWRGLLVDSEKHQRTAFGAALAIVLVAAVVAQMSFQDIILPTGHSTYAVLLLSPIALGAILLGTFWGTIHGLVAGIALYAHSILMPLDFHEVLFVTPFTSIFMLTACGFLLGCLFALCQRTNATGSRRIALIALACLIVSCFCSFGFETSTRISLLTNRYVYRVMSLFGAELDTETTLLGLHPLEVACQALINTVHLTAVCVAADALVRKTQQTADDIGIRDVFRISIFCVVVFVFIVMAAVSHVTVTISEYERSEASVRSEVNYLCLQLRSLDKRAAAFERIAKVVNLDPDSLTWREREDYDMLIDATGEVLSGYTMEETGTVAIIHNGTILMTDDKRLQIGSNVNDLLGRDINAAIKASTSSGRMQRIIYDGVLATTERIGGRDNTTQLGYLLSARFGEYTIMIIEPSSMVFRNRPTIIQRELTISIALLVSVFALVTELLSRVVAQRIDETNETLERITDGDLEARAAISGTREFKSLSAGINQTVDALNGWIAEAETRMDSELSAARAIQESALPRTFPPFPDITAFDIYASMDPAKEVGGDFYDFFLIDTNDDSKPTKLCFVIADVSGKGIPAALFMMKAKALIRDRLQSGMELGAAVTIVNSQLCDGNDADMFVTGWIGSLDYETRHIEYVNAGHNPPLVRRQDGSWQWLRKRSGPPLGIFDGVNYRTLTLDCDKHEKLLLYTDGVTEAMDVNERLYGEERLEALVNESGGLPPRQLVEAVGVDVARHAEGAEQSDDITIMSLEIGLQ